MKVYIFAGIEKHFNLYPFSLPSFFRLYKVVDISKNNFYNFVQGLPEKSRVFRMDFSRIFRPKIVDLSPICFQGLPHPKLANN